MTQTHLSSLFPLLLPCNISQLDIPLSEAFYKWMLGKEKTFTAQDLQHVDPIIARSYAQLAAVAVKKHRLESDPLLVRSNLTAY